MRTRHPHLDGMPKAALRSALDSLERSAQRALPEAGLAETADAAPAPASDGRVLIINPEGLAERGGMGRMVRYLVETIAARKDGPKVDVLDSRGRHGAWLSPFYLARTIYQITRAKRAGTVRLAHVNMAENLSVVRKGILVLLCRALDIPVLLHLHAGLFISFYERQSIAGKLWLKLVFRTATKIAVLGMLWKRYLVETLDVPAERIAVVPNGVARAAPRQRRAPGEPCRLLYVGKLRCEKGLIELIDALGEADLAALPWSLTLVGEGARSFFEAQARERGIAERVQFLGWLEPRAVREKLGDADIYVLPSHYEGMPLAVLEALSAGLAVVTTSVGALPEMIKDGETGLLVPPHDMPALHHALMRVILDHNLRDRLGRSGEALYTERFTVDKFCTSVLALYEEIAPTQAMAPSTAPDAPHDPPADHLHSGGAGHAKPRHRVKS